jgi:hypothetical protein
VENENLPQPSDYDFRRDELNGVQKILRDGHHIDAQIIEKYRNAGP